MPATSAFLVGLLFGIGLIVSGMTNPAKIIGFLDVTGPWDPSLAFVMAGAVAVGALAFQVARKRTMTFLGGALRLPTAGQVDLRLVLGSATFGIGWGLGGFCPGPALVSFGAGYDKAVVFLIAMLAGMAAFEAVERFGHGRGRTRTRRRSRWT